MKYIINNGTNNHVIITLHGTGGSATDLFAIAKYLDPQATLIGFQGEVVENGMARYFARYPDGSFNLESLKNATDDLTESFVGALKENNVFNSRITIIGYSNGANIMLNVLKEYENIPVNNIIFYHPSSVRPEVSFKQQKGLNVFITRGRQDPFLSLQQFDALETLFEEAKINAKSYSHDSGHQLLQEELDASRQWLDSLKK